MAAEEVTLLLHLLGPKRVHVMGYSVGAGVALSLAVMHGTAAAAAAAAAVEPTSPSAGPKKMQSQSFADDIVTDDVLTTDDILNGRDEGHAASPASNGPGRPFELASVCAFGFTSKYAECRTASQALGEALLCSSWLVHVIGVVAHGRGGTVRIKTRVECPAHGLDARKHNTINCRAFFAFARAPHKG